MKRIVFLLVAITMTNFLSAQTENYTVAIDSFQIYYNTENYNKIFNSFSPSMQQAVPLEKTKQFFTNLFHNVGKMETKEFVNYQGDMVAFYKVKFEKTILSIYISLDNQNKVRGLLVKPYEEETNADNRTVNALDSYPKDIAEILFDKVKGFPNGTQLSIAVIDQSETKYYGIIKENDSIKPIGNQDKVFEIGSITKVFTSTVLASLVLENKLKLTDNINSYFPFEFKDNAQISFESLANHTSGLPRLPENMDLSNKSNPYISYGKNEIEDYLKNYLKPKNNTSVTYSYSNLGAGLLGYTLGLSQKTTFRNLLQTKIFNKYKMTNSYTSSENLEKVLIKGLDEKGNEVSNWDFDVFFSAGGILSSAEDLAKFAEAQFDQKNKELTLTREPTFTINDQMKIGLGWHILNSQHGSSVVWHNGGTGGYSSSMVVDVENKFALIVLSNVSGFNPKMKNIDGLCFELTKKLDDKLL
ncbi:MAG TPA: serine hydrolase [Bacteroidales bacterium]|nr:serine hydrolase [Bacteroidales bacterium]